MRSHPNSSTFTRLIPSLLGVFFLLVQGSPSARAASEAQGTSGTIFQLSISQAENEVCVGQSVRVAIQWGPNTRYSENGGQAPLSPLTGPSRIALQAGLGRFYPESAPPGGAVSGTTTVTYTAEKEGNEKIFAVAWTGGESDAIASDTFKVKACEYFYTLNAQFDLAITSEDLSYHTRYTVKARGTLTPPDPNEPLHLEARNNYVTMNATMVSWSSSKCVLFTWEPGTGMGEVDARADPGPMGVGMQLQIAPPRDLAWNADLSFACNGDPVTVAGVYPVSSGDPWVSAFFPDGTGTQTVVLDMFEIPYNKLLGAEGISVSYTAKLTLERKDPK